MRSALPALALACALHAQAQEPAGWGQELEFHTFSIVAIDPATGESGVAVTTRRPCVGNVVPWVRAGVGAVATQGRTRPEYGRDLLDLIERGMSPQDAMDRVVAADPDREHRQVGVIDVAGRSAQWTGRQQYRDEARGDYVAMRSGENYAVQGNALVTTAIVDAVAETFAASTGKSRHLADRLIEALAAGQALGGDYHHGETQSAAVIVADPRPGMSRHPEQVSVDISVCEHPTPVAELRRVYDTISETLGFRELRQFRGRDVMQLRVMLDALGYLELPIGEIDPALRAYDAVAIAAVDAFRADQKLSTGVPGLVDARTVERLWSALEAAGKADAVRERLLEIARVDR